MSCRPVRRCLSVAAAVAFGAGLLAAGGCGDETLTYAREARATGMTCYQKGDYVDAAAAFANATRQDPRDYLSYYYLGASYQATGQYQQAIGAYRSCQAEQQTTLAGRRDGAVRYQTFDNLARCIAKGGTAGAEETALEAKLRGAPDADDQWMLAKIFNYNMQPDEAITAYTQAVLLDPSRFDIAKEAGLYEEGIKQNKMAAETLKKAYAVNPNDDEVNAALRRLGVVLGPSLRDERTLSHM
jgi:tetratricopeptide (TPR) repeat protein